MVESPALMPGAGPGFAGLAPAGGATARFTLGHAGLDAALGGGLARGRMHEIYAGSAADQAAATGFALMLALCAGGAGGNIVWLAEGRRADGCPLYPPGLAELGADPARLLFVTAPDEKALLRAAADVVRSPAAGTAVISPAATPRLMDLTGSRRLALAAERSGVTAIVLRGIGEGAPSAAVTRWSIAAAPSTALEADAPGAPAFHADLTRQRGGAPSPGWRLEWDRDARAFTERAPLSGAVVPAAGARLLAAAS